MQIFLFVKQFVDMLYQFRFLDICMLVFAVYLISVKLIKKGFCNNLKDRIHYCDYLMGVLFFVETVSFLRDTSFLTNYVKISSALLLYVFGRCYGLEIFQKGRWLAIASYCIVYLNFIVRFIQFGWSFTVGNDRGLLNSGGLYYYKTDLACAMLLSIIFIYFYGENRIFKYFTIFIVCGYMVFYSGARMEMVVVVIMYGMILFHIITKNKGKTFICKIKGLNILTAVILGLGLISFIVIQILPYDKVHFVMHEMNEYTLLDKIMHSRHVIWWNLGDYFSNRSFITRCIGIDLGTEWLHSGSGDRAHSMYVKQLYATGYIGCMIGLMIVSCIIRKIFTVCNRRYAFMCLCIWVMFLMMGLTIESFEYTQMSWFPFMFAGALVSTPSVEEKVE